MDINYFLPSNLLTNSALIKFILLCLVFVLVLLVAVIIFNLSNDHSIQARKKVVQLNNKNQKSILFNIAIKFGDRLFLRNPDEDSLAVDAKRLLHAGYVNKNSLQIFYGIKILLILMLMVLVFLDSPLFVIVEQNIVVLMVGALSIGYILPSFYLDNKITARQKIISKSLPDIIDQLVVCSEAGLGFETGLQRIVIDAEINNEVMAYELGMVIAELRSGVDIEKAFLHLLDRTGVDDIKGFTNAITQSIRFGTSIADTLRAYSEDIRDKHLQAAEEQAAKLAVKMMMPLAFCFFPGIFIVILGPAIISIMKSMS